jgi:hypothetical protein
LVFCFVFYWNLGLNSGLHACRAGALLHEPYLQSIFLWLFGDGISWAISLGWLWTAILLISAFQVATITDVNHWRQAASCCFHFPSKPIISKWYCPWSFFYCLVDNISSCLLCMMKFCSCFRI